MEIKFRASHAINATLSPPHRFEWYERRCLLQEKVVNFCFQTGTLAIIGCLMTYMKGHLTLGDPEEMLVAKTAFTCFASILGGFAIASNMLSCLGATWWTSVWKKSAALAPSTATPSSRRRIDGVEVDAKIQHERAVKF